MLKEFKKNIYFYLFIASILVIGLFFRIYNLPEILNFHYDQGRDALVIWDLINKHKFFLIGPTTGIAGVFRGPFYYYLIAPLYFFGQGNPVWPAVFLAIISMLAVLLMYFLAKDIGGKKVGLIAVILGSFSFEVIYASRWLSNPTPMLLLSMVLVWCLFKIQDGEKKFAWVILSFILGLSFFHFGSSGELFYFPAVFLFAIIFKKFPSFKVALLSLFSFLITFLPLFIFNLKHGGILLNNINNIVGSEKSFGIPTWKFLLDRLTQVFVYLSSTIFHNPFDREIIYLLILGLLFVYLLPKVILNNRFKVVFIVLLSPVVGLLFYQGNYGNFYQYYLTGYYLIFLLGLSYFVGVMFEQKKLFRILPLYFLIFFVLQNYMFIKPYLNTGKNDPGAIVLGTQKEAIDNSLKELRKKDSIVVLMDATGTKFNQQKSMEMSKIKHLILIAGHYEGVDHRVHEHLVDEVISIGDYVLTGGEIPSMVLVDSIIRLIPGVLGKDESSSIESHMEPGYLEYPQYTRPEKYNGWDVPKVLLSGNHQEIDTWRKKH